jgi:hypothetical protein
MNYRVAYVSFSAIFPSRTGDDVDTAQRGAGAIFRLPANDPPAAHKSYRAASRAC